MCGRVALRADGSVRLSGQGVTRCGQVPGSRFPDRRLGGTSSAFSHISCDHVRSSFCPVVIDRPGGRTLDSGCLRAVSTLPVGVRAECTWRLSGRMRAGAAADTSAVVSDSRGAVTRSADTTNDDGSRSATCGAVGVRPAWPSHRWVGRRGLRRTLRTLLRCHPVWLSRVPNTLRTG